MHSRMMWEEMGKGWKTFQTSNLKCNVGCPLANPLANLPMGILHVAPASVHLSGSSSPPPSLASCSYSPPPSQWRTHFCYFSLELFKHPLCAWFPAEPRSQLAFYLPRNKNFHASWKIFKLSLLPL